MANWNEPTNSTLTINLLGILNEKIANAAKMDFGTDTNLPSGAIRYNTTTNTFQSWNGATWSTLPIAVADAFFLGPETSDASDNQSWSLGGGGASGSSRGSTIILRGNEVATVGGEVQIVGGAVSTGHIILQNSHASADIRAIGSGGTVRMRLTDSGNLGLGIGTSAPAARLHVSGSEESEGSAYGQVIIRSAALYNATPRPGIIFQIEQDSSNTLAYTASIYAEKVNTGDGDRRTTLNFATRASSGTTVRRWQIDESGRFVQDSTSGSDIVLNLTTAIIRQGTSDATDDKRIQLCGGGSNSTSRGGFISIEGNEYGGGSGAIGVYPGDLSTGHIILEPTHSSAQVRVRHNNATRWAFQSDGTLAQDASNGSNLVLSRGNTSVVQRVAATVTAAGTTSANATVLDSIYNAVTTVASGTGVRLTNVSNGGSPVFVQNLGANDLEVYPPTGGAINGAATDAGITLAAASDQIGVFVRYANNNWMGFVVNAPTT